MNPEYEKVSAFKKNITTFKETSRDSSESNDVYMTQSQIEVVNFDNVKSEYIRNLKLTKTPLSSDALFIKSKNEIYFVEFKNGKISKKVIYNVYNKIYDSLLIYMDIIEKNISFCRENVNFILVYNESKNPKEPQDSAKASIGKHFANKAKKKYVRFDLQQFERLYFHEVNTYTEEEFEHQFLENLNI